MVFASPIFMLGFLPLCVAGALLLPAFLRNIFLLGMSLLFYAWGGPGNLTLLLGLVALNYAAGLGLEATAHQNVRTLLLSLICAADLGVLLHAKYTNFFLDNLNAVRAALGMAGIDNPGLILPLGISFFTFHLLSYVIDVWRGGVRAQRNPVNFALYICFFPQAIAGPIIRYHDICGQLARRVMSVEGFASGLERVILGLGKKTLLANPFGEQADRIFALGAADLSAPVAWLGLVLYALQLYFDFSGYSDMAIGMARMFGFDYLENFNYPFMACSISEFWRRWHISLSNWFRDYMYTPLVLRAARRHAARQRAAGSRRRFDDRPYLALVFMCCGFWHGASWNFLVWGGLHGVFLALERGAFGRALRAAPRPLRHAYVLCVILLAWVFFRAPSLRASLVFLAAMAGNNGAQAAGWPVAAFVNRQILVLLPFGLLGLTPALSWLSRDWRARALQFIGQTGQAAAGPASLEATLMLVRPPVLLGMLVLSCASMAGQSYNPFIYFRF